MGGFPFGGGYFALYDIGTSVIPPAPPIGGGGAIEHLRPYPTHLDADIALVLEALTCKVLGKVTAAEPAYIGLTLEALTVEVMGAVHAPIPATISDALRPFLMSLHGTALTPADLKDQRLVRAFRAMPITEQAKFLQMAEKGHLSRPTQHDDDDQWLLLVTHALKSEDR